MQDFQQQNQQSPMWLNLMDILNILSFAIGLQNLELNITANDLEKASSSIVDNLNEHLQDQDIHLKNQDDHLKNQDDHLKSQDERLDRLEGMLLELLHSRKEN